VVDAVAKCESLDYYALDTLKSEEMAFKQCNIVIKDLTLHNNSEEYNNKTIGKSVCVFMRAYIYIQLSLLSHTVA